VTNPVLQLVALVGAAAMLVSGCGGTAAPSPTASAAPNSSPSSPIPAGQAVTIRFDSYNYGAPGIGGKGTQQLIDEFQALYPNIKIQAKNVVSTEMLNSTVAQAAAGDPPDVAQLVLNTLEFAVTNLPVQAIDQIAPKAEYDDMVMWIGLEHASEFDPAAFDIEAVNRGLVAVGSPR